MSTQTILAAETALSCIDRLLLSIDDLAEALANAILEAGRIPTAYETETLRAAIRVCNDIARVCNDTSALLRELRET